MKTSTTSQRLQEIMAEKGLRQIDLLKLVQPYCEKYGIRINKSNISQYVNGTNEPQQDKLFALCVALDVSEGWLMGHDVPRKRPSDAERFANFADAYNSSHPDLLTINERRHIEAYRKLTDELRKRVDTLTDALLAAQEAEQDLLLAAHARTDTPTDKADVDHDISVVKQMDAETK